MISNKAFIEVSIIIMLLIFSLFYLGLFFTIILLFTEAQNNIWNELIFIILLNLFAFITLFFLNSNTDITMHNFTVNLEEYIFYEYSYYNINNIDSHKCNLPLIKFGQLKNLVLYYDYYNYKPIYNSQ